MKRSDNREWVRRTAVSFAIGLAMFGGGFLPIPADRAAAQASAEALALTVPPNLQLAPGRESVLPVQISPAAVIPRRAILLIRGMPASVVLSEGKLFASGVWGVPAADFGRVTLSVSAGATGRNDLSFSVVSLDGTVLAEGRSTLFIGATATRIEAAATGPGDKTLFTAAPPQSIPLPSTQPASAPAGLAPQEVDQLRAILNKGDEQMATGNVAAARLLYRHVADKGLAAGALALATSFDAEELSKRNVKGGVQPDPKQAQLWYEKALALGSGEAQDRLQRLGAR